MTIWHRFVLAVSLAGILAFSPATTMFVGAQESGKELRAGISKIDITPESPVQMGGYANRKALSEGVHDPLFARALAFQSGGKRLVLVSIDIVGLGDAYEFLQKPILAEYGLRPEELLLGTTHTHSGPIATLNKERGHPNNIAYTESLKPKLLKAVGEALRGVTPVHTAVGSGYSPVGAYRRVFRPDGSSREGGRSLDRNPYGPTDKQVLVLKVVQPDGSPLAAMFNYATHNTSLGPRNLLISGDVLGIAEDFVERILGKGVLAPVLVGAGGDIDPWYRVLPGFNTEPGWIPESVLLGTLLGEEAVHAFRNAKDVKSGGDILTAARTIMVPGKKPQSLEIGKDPNLKTSITLTAARIGDAVLVTIPGGVGTEIGLAIKAGSKYKNTFVITECNDKAGYIPSENEYSQGGYEVFTSRSGPEAAGMVIKAALQLIYQLGEPGGGCR